MKLHKYLKFGILVIFDLLKIFLFECFIRFFYTLAVITVSQTCRVAKLYMSILYLVTVISDRLIE